MPKNNHHRTYHRASPQKNFVPRPVRLSQCMIVKNEEKNIAKALSWAKSIAFEQIVVDTGSTDRTVEIAESMGAKIYHFEWINDFSAAKNYAIKQATGNWIAFLDADEYFPDKDAQTLMTILKTVESDPTIRNMKSAIRCPIANVDDEGKPFLIFRQDRVFRNAPEIYYSGKIHERLMTKDPIMHAPELTIIHTGYTHSAYEETKKAYRNVDMLREELNRDPENADLKCYLADSLRATGDKQDAEEAEALYRDALLSGQMTLRELKQGAYNFLIANYFENEEKDEENFALCIKAYEEFPENPDFCFYYGRKLYVNGDYSAAWEKLLECERLLMKDTVDLGSYVLKNPMLVFYQMTITAEELGDTHEVIRCATLALKEDKYQQGMLAPYINAFSRKGFETPVDDLFTLLGKMYDFNNVKDKVTVMRAAKTAGNMPLVAKVLSTLTQEEYKWLTEPPE